MAEATSEHLTSIISAAQSRYYYDCSITHTKPNRGRFLLVDRTAAGHRPPDTVVGVASLAKGDILYECEVWAIVH